ncbi:MAG: hypothetical protein A2W18_11240 [Candidatus Muproteobacteria bacterium RBG_16_60_9]|uniref:Formate dehydrogenase n=1 Tax=Candidatus Muproteobacteria bacterium RBG_16_60_9 TaxID=1817755 RepID=A0A1F6V087_9PROT|nr:MAG: hypothetical protein A2W18_11240 [Candidatus Muproteobacteria bacterium RBG_16_60_9]
MSDEHTSEKRREFLKGALIGSGAALAAIASGGALAAAEKKESAATPAAPASQGYQTTPHVLDYYKAAQF